MDKFQGAPGRGLTREWLEGNRWKAVCFRCSDGRERKVSVAKSVLST
jgi:hypothetical protein